MSEDFRNFDPIRFGIIQHMDLLVFAIEFLFMISVCPTEMAAAANAGHSVMCTTGSQLAAAFTNPDIRIIRIQTDITLVDDDWKSFTVPVIVRRNFTLLGNQEQPPLLDMGNVRGKVQLQDGASIIFRYLIIANWRTGSFRQAPGMDLLLAMPPGQLSVLRFENCSAIFQVCFPISFLPESSNYGPRPAIIPGNNTRVKTYPPPATCSNSSCAPPSGRCYAFIAEYEDMAIEGQDLMSNGVAAPNGYLVHLQHMRGLCQRTMTKDCITRLSAVGCALYMQHELDASQNSNTSANGTSGSNTAKKCVRNEIKGGRICRLVGAVVGGALGGAILIAVMVLVLLWATRRRQTAKGPADSASCGKGVTGKSEHQVIKMNDLLRTGSAGPCGALEVGGDGHDPVGCGDRHDDAKNLGLSQKTPVELPDGSNDSSEVPAASAKEGVRPEDVGHPSTLLAADGGATAISPACAMQPVTLNTSNRAELGLVVLTNSNTEQPSNMFKVAADSALPTPPAGVGISRPAANTAPTDSASNVVTLSPVVLGRGACGRVYEGMYRGTRVAVKVVGHEAIWGPAVAAVKGKPLLGLPQPLPIPGLKGRKLPDAVLHESALQQQFQQHQQQPVAAAVQAEVKGGVIMGAGADSGAGDPGHRHPCQQQQQQHKQHEGKRLQDALALDASVLLQLQQEVEVLGRCDHPNVVRLLGACLSPPRMCLVMELAETSLDHLLFGGTLCGALLPLDKVLHIAIQIAQGLEYLHPTIVHRDLKPANVLINGANSSRPVAKLSDFGLSRLRSATMPTMHPDAGTPAYMAPECYDLNNNVITHQADMYSYGVLLWTMLTGQTPWKGLSILEIAYNVTLRGQRPPMHNLSVYRCPPKLSQIMRQCWEGDPLRRPAAAEVVKELQLLTTQLRNNEVVASREPGSNGVYNQDQSPVGDTLNHYVRQAAVPYTTAPYGTPPWDAIISSSCSISLDLLPDYMQHASAQPISNVAPCPAVAIAVVTPAVSPAAAAAVATAATRTVVTSASTLESYCTAKSTATAAGH